jgi:hypothetical protein
VFVFLLLNSSALSWPLTSIWGFMTMVWFFLLDIRWVLDAPIPPSCHLQICTCFLDFDFGPAYGSFLYKSHLPRGSCSTILLLQHTEYDANGAEYGIPSN